MIGRKSHVHKGCNLELIVGSCCVFVDNYALLSSAHGQDASLGRVNDSREVMDTKHAQVRDSEGTTGKLIWLELVLAGASSDILDLSGDLLESLKVCVFDDGGHETVVGLDGDAHVDILELSNEVISPFGVCLWDFFGSKRSGLNDHIVDGDLRARVLVQFSTESDEVIDLDLNGDIVVRDVLFRVGQSFGDDLADLAVFEVFVSGRGRGETGHGAAGSSLGGGFGGRGSSLSYWLGLVLLDVSGEDSVVRSSASDSAEGNTLLFSHLSGQGASKDSVSTVG